MITNLFEDRIRKRFARLMPASRTQIVIRGGERQARLSRDLVEDFERLSGYFWADAIACDDGQRVGGGHAFYPNRLDLKL